MTEPDCIPNRERLLIVDDDIELCGLVREYLGTEGIEVEAVHDGESGVRRALADDLRLVVLDVMLPRIGGFDVLRRIRAQSSIPVIMLTARGTDVDKIVGLEMGADDYIAKPFNCRELLARIRAILRRSTVTTDTFAVARSKITIDDIMLDEGSRRVLKAGQPIDLTSMEFEVLRNLLSGAGRVITREGLYKAVVGGRLLPGDRCIDMHVSHLRKKLGPMPGKIERIKTIRSVGYMYALLANADKAAGTAL